MSKLATEQCANGHTRTEQNTSWVKDSNRNRTKRVCLDCRRVGRALKGTPSATDLSRQRTDDAHEDLEDLIRFGATYAEIMERGPFASWDSLTKSLKRRGRHDLLDAMRQKKEMI